MSIKFKKTLLAAMCILLLHGISFGQWSTIVIYGDDSPQPNKSIRYTASLTNIAPYYYWSVTGGVFSNGQSTMVKTGTFKYEAYVTWNCNSSLQGISCTAFTAWPPTGTPVGVGSKSIDVQCYQPPVHDCAYYQSTIDGIYQNAPVQYRCQAIMSVVYEAQSQGLNCNFNTYGCY